MINILFAESVIIQARYKELGQLRKAIPYKVGMQVGG